ncbi:MAG: glycosyltransferase family 2 protein [Crocosphaera sp.]
MSSKVFTPINKEIRLSATILIPAHNEAEVIAQSLDSLCPQLMSCDRIVVIADNCSDQTSEIVRKKGITVIERDNTEQRGKGYAIDYGIKYLSNHPPDIVVILDADCFMEAETLDHSNNNV